MLKVEKHFLISSETIFHGIFCRDHPQSGPNLKKKKTIV